METRFDLVLLFEAHLDEKFIATNVPLQLMLFIREEMMVWLSTYINIIIVQC